MIVNTLAINTLHHGQQIQIPGSSWATPITVRTARGFRADRLRWEMLGFSEQQIMTRAQEEIDAQAAHMAESGLTYDSTPWTIQASGALDSYHRGSEALQLAKQREHARAMRLFDGEVVLIEGTYYRVKINGPQYSDPVTFSPA